MQKNKQGISISRAFEGVQFVCVKVWLTGLRLLVLNEMVSMHVGWVQSLLLENLVYGAMMPAQLSAVRYSARDSYPIYTLWAGCIHHGFVFENVIQS